ncbi:C-5 sterol desaturase [Leptospira wolffii]|uniref:C-5 sterol desaturase n=1 Tax=Leptospira wolffii TaxID=409998 RepID=A0A2M9ZAP6_9LEPT|nr:sterol desaturase family protein [Leptospira wolffii]PJZ65511.1 C-5 sterol desaturase [Leptospira wolffii]
MNSLGEIILQTMKEMTLFQAFFLFLIENLLILGFSVWIGNLLVRKFQDRRISPKPFRIEFQEILWASSTLLLNTAVTVAGLYLWRYGLITFRNDLGPMVLFDTLVLFMAMDASMYFLHRIAHISWVYPLAHKTHHRYENPRPLTLFVLNPFEALGFGILWLSVISLYDSSWIGMSIYLVLNVVFGTLGHLGVEPFPDSWLRLPIFRFLTTSTFHARHHQFPDSNFGFYTSIWDIWFGTLYFGYEQSFGKLPET